MTKIDASKYSTIDDFLRVFATYTLLSAATECKKCFIHEL